MSETLDEVMARRAAYRAGRNAGLELLSGETSRTELEDTVASLLIDSQGLEHSFNQGTWHTIQVTPLCFVRKRLGRELIVTEYNNE